MKLTTFTCESCEVLWENSVRDKACTNHATKLGRRQESSKCTVTRPFYILYKNSPILWTSVCNSWNLKNDSGNNTPSLSFNHVHAKFQQCLASPNWKVRQLLSFRHKSTHEKVLFTPGHAGNRRIPIGIFAIVYTQNSEVPTRKLRKNASWKIGM